MARAEWQKPAHVTTLLRFNGQGINAQHSICYSLPSDFSWQIRFDPAFCLIELIDGGWAGWADIGQWRLETKIWKVWQRLKSPIFCFLSIGNLSCVDCRLVSVRGLLPSLPKFIEHWSYSIHSPPSTLLHPPPSILLRGADLCSALGGGGIILEIDHFLSKFQLWGGWS